MTVRLFILEPEVIFSGLVNQASITYPLDEFEYDGVITGTFSVVYLNQTVLFGTSEGDDSLGRSRIRKFPDSNTLYIGRSSRGVRDGEVDLADNDTFSVVNLYQVWIKTPFIDADGVTFMDSDLDFATYGADSPPVANAGGPVMATVNGSNIITVEFDSVNSFATAAGATISSVLWEIDGGTITVGTSSSAAITATFPTGFHWITLTVTDSNAKLHQTHVPVLAMAADYSNCINHFEIDSHRITPEGQELAVTIREDIDAATFIDGTLVLLADGEPSAIDERDNILFCGWIQDEQNMIRAQHTGTLKDVTLRCVDVAGRMKELPGFPQVLEHNASPSTWQQFDTPDMRDMLHYLLQWQSTALDLADYLPAAATANYPFKILASEGASLWEQVSRRAMALVPDYRLTCSRRGALQVIVDPMLQESGDRTATVQATLTADEYSDLQYNYTRHPRVHWLRSNAILADTNTVAAAFCIAPGESPGQGETDITHGEQLALTQADLNAVTGHRYARVNARDGTYRIALAQAATSSALEPSDLTWVRLTIPASVAGPRGRTLTTVRGLVNEITLRYDDRGTGLVRTASLLWERETTGTPAVTVIPATADPVDPTDPLVPDVTASAPSFDGGIVAAQDIVAILDDKAQIYKTSNFSDSSPNWTKVTSHTSGFGGTVTLYSAVVDPFSSLYRGLGSSVDAFLATGGGIWHLEDIFGTPSVTNLVTFATGITTSSGRWRTIAASFGRYQADEADNPWIMCATNYGGASPKGTRIIYSTDGGATWSSEIEVTGAGYNETGTPSGQQLRPALWLSPRTPGYAITYAPTETGVFADKAAYYTTDWGATWTVWPDNSLGGGEGLAGSLHVPWPDNASEDVMYSGHLLQGPTLYEYSLKRRNSASSVTDVSPTAGGATYGPRQGLFGVRTFDGDRRYVVGTLYRNGVDDTESNDFVGVFYSSDYGNSWTQVIADIECDVNSQFPLQSAFSADDPDMFVVFGNEAYIRASYDGGATIDDKYGDLAPTGVERFPLLVGG